MVYLAESLLPEFSGLPGPYFRRAKRTFGGHPFPGRAPRRSIDLWRLTFCQYGSGLEPGLCLAFVLPFQAPFVLYALVLLRFRAFVLRRRALARGARFPRAEGNFLPSQILPGGPKTYRGRPERTPVMQNAVIAAVFWPGRATLGGR